MSIGAIPATVPLLPPEPATHGHPRRDPNHSGQKGDDSRRPPRREPPRPPEPTLGTELDSVV